MFGYFTEVHRVRVDAQTSGCLGILQRFSGSDLMHSLRIFGYFTEVHGARPDAQTSGCLGILQRFTGSDLMHRPQDVWVFYRGSRGQT